MQTIEITKDNAIEAYKAADGNFKPILEKLLGKENVLTSLRERCTTMADVFREAGEDPDDFEIPKDATPRQISRIRHARVDLIFEVFREGKELTLADKWFYPWYNRPTPGSGFSLGVVYYDDTSTGVGARLCACDAETVRFIDKHFRDEITAYHENRPA